ncbi:tRNA-splicing endonuclease subunit Sen2 [Patella vulgata]|uniref:tRNA-splicing endonuclease subunit Sen2 n=1 Tax=Patella vulgata TaxID=6465 RepID=UPI0024A90F22|nr:tRNA-splicing endonuclease subunit Sen2 [Patella vulgata]XP_050406163.2 tRNA-splicing endonuclease subunit Sen2 [Patella vulgata]
MSLTAPRRKKRVRQKIQAPFPVPIKTITGETASKQHWLYYTGYLCGQSVTVRHTGDMEFLYKMGFFGKGNLSRSRPDYNDKYKWAAITSLNGDRSTIYPRVVNKQWYKRHLQWGGQELQEDEISEGEEENLNTNSNMDKGDSNKKEISDDMTTDENGQSNGKESDEIKIEDSWAGEPDNEFWGVETNQSDSYKSTDPWDSGAAASWDTAEGDADFWGTGIDNVKSDSCSWKKPTCDMDNDKDSLIVDQANPVTLNQEKTDLNQEQSDVLVANQEKYNSESLKRSAETCSTNSKRAKIETEDKQIPETDDKQKTIPVIADNCESLTENSDCDQIDKVDKDLEKVDKVETIDLSSYDLLCHGDDKHGDLFVIPNDNYDKLVKSIKQKLKWRPVLKQNPFPIKEYLQLSLVEAFFLSYGLGCFILKEKENSLNIMSMWKIFCEKQRNFIASYVTYHYFRSKGWVPKSGLKFGCDYILYKVGPPFYHGSYSVVIQYIEEDGVTPVLEYQQLCLSWRSLCGLNRITEHVAKEVMICYVVKPKNLTDKELLSPSCIPYFKVKEMLLSRWISSQERQNKEPEEIP